MAERDEMMARVRDLMEDMRGAMIRHRTLDQVPGDVTVLQLRALGVLYFSGGQSAHALAEALGAGPTALTGLVDRLESKGLAQRRTDPDDRRIRRVELTWSGTGLLDALEELEEENHRRVLGKLHDEDLARLVDALVPLVAAIREDAREYGADLDHRDGVDANLTPE